MSDVVVSEGFLKKKYRKYVVIYLIIVAVFWGSQEYLKGLGYRVFFTQSASVNGFVYVAKPARGDIEIGQMVVFPLPQATNVKGDVIKEIFAVSGDEVLNNDGRIFINGEFKFIAKPYSLAGDSLVAISSQTIPEGFVFVGGHMKDSFDSRYERFGLIPVSEITSVGKKVF